LDPFRIEFPGDFVWEIPSELRGRIELMRRKRAGNTGETLATRFDRATNQQGLGIQLGQLVTPGDRIALAVDPHLPSLDAIVRLLLEELRRLKASLSESCVVFPPSAGALPQAVRDWLDSEEALREVQVITYDPEDRAAMAYLAADADGNPIYLARALVDADVVIPVFAPRADYGRPPGAMAIFIYQQFAGADVEEPTRDTSVKAKRKDDLQLRTENQRNAEEAFWQLGVLCGVVVSAAAGGECDRIAFGGASQLNQACEQAFQDWQCAPVPSSGLVLAEVSGGAAQQHWGAAAQAIQIAAELSSHDAMIVLLTDIEEGEIRKRASRGKRRDEHMKGVRPRDRGASEFLSALEEVRGVRPVFLRSRMSEETTEALGMGFVSSPADLDRLIRRQPRCILIRDAQNIRLEAPAEKTSSPAGRDR
jgi:hypothetical protein